MSQSIHNPRYQIATHDGRRIPILVSHNATGSMIDGKCRGAVLGKGCQRCAQCGAYPRDMNDVDKLLDRELDPGTAQQLLHETC